MVMQGMGMKNNNIVTGERSMIVTELGKYYLWKNTKYHRIIIRIPRFIVKILKLKTEEAITAYTA